MISTMLDPRYRMVFNEFDAEDISWAKKECLKMLMPGEKISSSEEDPRDDAAPSESDLEPSSKRRKLSHL
jgi:hypothetical protein